MALLLQKAISSSNCCELRQDIGRVCESVCGHALSTAIHIYGVRPPGKRQLEQNYFILDSQKTVIPLKHK